VRSPYAWDPHIATWTALIVSMAAISFLHLRSTDPDRMTSRWTRREIIVLVTAWGAAAVALTWPLADLAAHWSLTALVTQRLILTLAIPPLVLLGLPYDALERLTRPAGVDALFDWCRRPAVAILVFTAVAVGSMTTPLVEAQASSSIVRGVLDGLIVAAGFVLWLPVIGRAPGILRLKPIGRFSYLVAQAVIPAFLSFVYIFAHRPLYNAFARSHLAIGLRPLNDQQISGFVSKLTMLFVLLTVGAVVLARAERSDDEFGDSEPLLWADVERQFERAVRRGDRNESSKGDRSESNRADDRSSEGLGGKPTEGPGEGPTEGPGEGPTDGPGEGPDLAEP
jgi:cytochrome c oxidase assembly factor CtaG